MRFNIAIDKRTKTRSATNLELVKSKEYERERGKIYAVKSNFGFIRGLSREKDVYFHFSGDSYLYKLTLSRDRGKF